MQDVGERIALGSVEAERQRRANVEGAEVQEIDGLLLAFANVPHPPVNSVLVISELCTNDWGSSRLPSGRSGSGQAEPVRGPGCPGPRVYSPA